MGAIAAFGIGVLIGALGAFGAGRRYERAHHAYVIAAGYVGDARVLTGGAVRGALLLAGLVLVGALFLWAGN